MAAVTHPETIVPSSLLSYTGQDFTTIGANLPNGDDSILLTSSSASGAQKAHQAMRTDSHLVQTGQDQALSFWIRRRASFTTSTSVSSSSSGASVSLSGLIMGVGDASATSAASSSMSWALWASATQSVQFGYGGYANGARALYCGGSIALATNTWHLLVVNVPSFTGTSTGPKGQYAVYLDGVVQQTVAPTGSSIYYFSPSSLISNFASTMRFSLGDPTQGAATVRTADGASLDIAKIAFHDQQLQVADQLRLLESMRYGG